MPTSNHLPRPGHNPGHVRCAFIEAIEDGEPSEIYAAAGKVLSCTDVLPSDCRNLLDIPRGSNYAQAARAIRT
jgi:LSD1 subclass zinc finger protein